MELTLIRTSRQEKFTTGVLYAGKELMGYTLEPQWRDLRKEEKVMGQTAIPEGVYEIRLALSPRFMRLMPYLQNVPGFTDVMIHCGNTVEDTRGCVLIGKRSKWDTLVQSRSAFNKLYARLEAAEEAGEPVAITVT